MWLRVLGGFGLEVLEFRILGLSALGDKRLVAST